MPETADRRSLAPTSHLCGTACARPAAMPAPRRGRNARSQHRLMVLVAGCTFYHALRSSALGGSGTDICASNRRRDCRGDADPLGRVAVVAMRTSSFPRQMFFRHRHIGSRADKTLGGVQYQNVG